jgi:3-oxoacyl-[acyl-carrier protein] reductase
VQRGANATTVLGGFRSIVGPSRTGRKIVSDAAESTGRVALVTGGGRGIGRATALALARAGMTVAVNYRRDADAARRTVEDIVAAGGIAESFQAEVGVSTECRRMVEAVAQRLGPISVLVNNGGQATRAQPVASLDLSEAEAALREHALGPLELCQLVLPQLKAGPRGDVVMISSSAPRLHARGTASYAMAKAALEALAHVFANEVARDGIRVNIVAPGIVATEMGTAVVKGVMGGAAEVSDLDAHAPFGRVCRPDDVANTVAFLVSDAGSYITGTRLTVDGGKPGWVGPRAGQ